MKASELVKKSISIEEIHNRIIEDNKIGHFKHFIPHFFHVSNEVIIELGREGFKVYEGEFDRNIRGWIIEW